MDTFISEVSNPSGNRNNRSMASTSNMTLQQPVQQQQQQLQQQQQHGQQQQQQQQHGQQQHNIQQHDTMIQDGSSTSQQQKLAGGSRNKQLLKGRLAAVGRQQCCYTGRRCSRARVPPHRYCMTHILDERNTSYKQCTYRNHRTGRRCIGASLKSCARDSGALFCARHAAEESKKTDQHQNTLTTDRNVPSQLNEYSRIIKCLEPYKNAWEDKSGESTGTSQDRDLTSDRYLTEISSEQSHDKCDVFDSDSSEDESSLNLLNHCESLESLKHLLNHPSLSILGHLVSKKESLDALRHLVNDSDKIETLKNLVNGCDTLNSLKQLVNDSDSLLYLKPVVEVAKSLKSLHDLINDSDLLDSIRYVLDDSYSTGEQDFDSLGALFSDVKRLDALRRVVNEAESLKDAGRLVTERECKWRHMVSVSETSGLLRAGREEGDSDGGSCDSEGDEPLSRAQVLTAEEVSVVLRDKLIRLQSLYIDQFKRLHHTLRERRRDYLHACQLYKARPAKSSHSHTGNSDLSQTSIEYRALSRYQKRRGLEAWLHDRCRQRRAASSSENFLSTSTTSSQSLCCHVVVNEEGQKESCTGIAIPLTKYCYQHILSDARQVLYTKCHWAEGSCSAIGSLLRHQCCDLHVPLSNTVYKIS